MPKKKFKLIPDRWEDYSNVGAKVPGTKFIAFKVPLYFHRDWNLSELKNSVPDLKSIIDLTNTSRYYKPKDCQELDIQHRKIFLPGRVVPTKSAVQEFYSAVEEFTAHAQDGLIGVHCTHGLNRTGYMICRYMIEKDGLDPETAISAFDDARGHKQERENLLEHLRTKGWENETNNEVPEENKETSSSYRDRDQRHNGNYHKDKKHNYRSKDHFNRNSYGPRDRGYQWTPNREYHSHRGRHYNDDSYYGYGGDQRTSYNENGRRDYDNSWGRDDRGSWRRDERSSWRRDDRSSWRREDRNDWGKGGGRHYSAANSKESSSTSTSHDKSSEYF